MNHLYCIASFLLGEEVKSQYMRKRARGRNKCFSEGVTLIPATVRREARDRKEGCKGERRQLFLEYRALR